MFTGFDVDFGKGDATKIFVKRNGGSGPLKEVRLPPHSKIGDLLEKAGKALDLEAPHRAFFSNGVECSDVDLLEDDAVIHISCGEPFRASEGQRGAGNSRVVGNFIIHEKLGQGGFGSVMKGVHTETGEMAAVKFVPKNSFRQFSDLQRVFQEIQALRNLHHPNVIRILDVADHPENVCFIMEFASGGELRGYVERNKALSEEESRVFFKQIVRAVHYVHSKKIIHRDLKLENILLDGQNRCKIVDFGLSDYVSSKEKTVTDAGTEAYLAPEVYNGHSGESDPYKIDVWSLGVILYALTHGFLPFSRPDWETCAKLDVEGPQFKGDLSSGYRRLVTAMLTPSPARRATVDEISIDPWVTKHRFANCDMLSPSGGSSPSPTAGADSGKELDEKAESEASASSEGQGHLTSPKSPSATDGCSSAPVAKVGPPAATTAHAAGLVERERRTLPKAGVRVVRPRNLSGPAGRDGSVQSPRSPPHPGSGLRGSKDRRERGR